MVLVKFCRSTVAILNNCYYNNIMNTFKHSGAAGDLIYGLAVMKTLGGGELKLHLNQMDWIGQHYYGSKPDPYHQGRLTQKDFEYMRSFMEAQTYISKFSILDPATDEVTHNLDRFRTPFASNPGNYIDVYCHVMGIHGDEIRADIRNNAWLTVPEPTIIEPVVINRTARWRANPPPKEWTGMRDHFKGWAVFVGHESEYQDFKKTFDWDLPFYPTSTQLELASVIAGANQFIGNQSQALALALGLGKDVCCEIRRDLPKERNECYFPAHPTAQWF